MAEAKGNITSLFGIPLYTRNVPDISNDVLLQNEWRPIINGQRTYGNKVLKDPRNAHYEQAMARCVDEFMYDVLLIKPHLKWRWTTSWGLKHDPGHYSQIHSHGNALFSVILYTHVPEKGGDLIIAKDSARPVWTTGTVIPDLVQLNSITASEVHIGVKNGDCVIFPAFCHHGSTKNESDGARYCLVGNIFISGKLVAEDDDDNNLDGSLMELEI